MRQHTTQKPSQPCPLAFSLHTPYLSIHWPSFHLPILRRKVAKLAGTFGGCSTQWHPQIYPSAGAFHLCREFSFASFDFQRGLTPWDPASRNQSCQHGV